MKLKIYIRLQQCNTNDRCAFVPRQEEAHGIAKGPIAYYVVETDSFAHARRMLKTDNVLNHTGVTGKTVQGFVKDIGTPRNTISLIAPRDVPQGMLYATHRRIAEQERKLGELIGVGTHPPAADDDAEAL